MAPKATTIFELVLILTWKCLCVPATGKNPFFSQVFCASDILYDIASAASLTFCPGLLDVIRSPTPPTIDFFKNLPDRILGLWGVYALVLEKAGHEDLVYIGSATHSDDSLVKRFKTYNRPNINDKNLPSKVREALQKGYKIVSKRVLVSAPIPSAKDVPRFRILFLALEAMFTFLFWAMYSKEKDYQIGSCCPWDLDSFTYGGLCSHSALNDFFVHDFEMTPLQLEMADAQNKENRKQREKDSKLRRLAVNPRYYADRAKEYQDNKKAADPQKYKEDLAQKYIDQKKDPEWYPKMMAQSKANKKKNKRTKKYHCSNCNYAAPDGRSLRRHKDGPAHKRCVERLAAGLKPFDYEPCGFEGKGCASWSHHNSSKLHKENVAAVGQHNQPSAEEKAKASNLYCYDCELPFKTAGTYEKHGKSAKHTKQVAKLARNDTKRED